MWFRLLFAVLNFFKYIFIILIYGSEHNPSAVCLGRNSFPKDSLC